MSLARPVQFFALWRYTTSFTTADAKAPLRRRRWRQADRDDVGGDARGVTDGHSIMHSDSLRSARGCCVCHYVEYACGGGATQRGKGMEARPARFVSV